MDYGLYGRFIVTDYMIRLDDKALLTVMKSIISAVFDPPNPDNTDVYSLQRQAVAASKLDFYSKQTLLASSSKSSAGGAREGTAAAAAVGSRKTGGGASANGNQEKENTATAYAAKLAEEKKDLLTAFGQSKESNSALAMTTLMQQFSDDSKKSDKDMLELFSATLAAPPVAPGLGEIVSKKRKACGEHLKNVGDFCKGAGVIVQAQLDAIEQAGYDMVDEDLGSFMSTFASATMGGGNVQENVKNALGVNTATAAKLLNYYNNIEAV